MSSGVNANDDCLHKFEELKTRKKFKYIIFQLSEDKSEIIVGKISTSSEYEDFLGDLPENQCRWAVYDLEFKNDEGSQRNKITFFQWSPESATVKDKMVTAASREALRRRLTGITVEIQGTDYSEVAYTTVLDKATKFKA